MNYEGPFKSKLNKFGLDISKSWEERYRALEKHHIEEIEEARSEIKRLEKIINDQVDKEIRASGRSGYPWSD